MDKFSQKDVDRMTGKLENYLVDHDKFMISDLFKEPWFASESPIEFAYVISQLAQQGKIVMKHKFIDSDEVYDSAVDMAKDDPNGTRGTKCIWIKLSPANHKIEEDDEGNQNNH